MSILSKLFGSQKKDYTYNGPRPVSTLADVPGGKEYYQNITDRLAGRGVGYGADYVGYANPEVTKSHDYFTSYQVPELKSELTASGRRGGSSGFQQLNKAYQEQGLNESAIVGRLAQRNAEASREDTNTALSGLGNYANNEVNLKNNAANFEYDKIYAPQVNREQDRVQAEAKGYQGLLDRGLQAAGYGLSSYAAPAAAAGGGFNDIFDSNTGAWKPTSPPSYYSGRGVSARLAARQGQYGGVR